MASTGSAQLSTQCSTAGDPDTCAVMAPGCRWSASCFEQQCNPSDTWCLQRRSVLPVCAPMVKAMVEGSTSGPGQVRWGLGSF